VLLLMSAGAVSWGLALCWGGLDSAESVCVRGWFFAASRLSSAARLWDAAGEGVIFLSAKTGKADEGW
jgi:hypothetical protein